MCDSDKTAVLFAGCEEELILPSEEIKQAAGMIVCADGGIEFCFRAGMKPNLVVGDFDSASPGLVERARLEGARIVEFPQEKDETDLDIALKMTYRAGINRCMVYGALGGRIDHEMTNILLLRRYACMGMKVSLIGRTSSIDVLTHEYHCRFEGKSGCPVSLIPISEILCGVRTKGMKYELHGDDMVSGSSRGVSNIIVEDYAEISCVTGEAAVITSGQSSCS